MSIFPIHTPESAPEAARPILEGAARAYGFVPNLLGALAEAPAALEAYVTLADILDKSSFTPTERAILPIAISAENGCEYCLAAHSAAARRGKVPDDVISAVREDRPLADARLEALRSFALTLVRKRGWASDEEVQSFLDAGFSRQNALETVLFVAFKTLSNYANHLVSTPVDAAFKAAA